MRSLLRSRCLSTLGILTFFSASASATVYGPGAGFTITDLSNNTSTIVVPSGGAITSFNSLTLTGLTHTFAGDLLITLSNGTTTVDIIDRVGGGADLGGTFVFAPAGSPLGPVAFTPSVTGGTFLTAPGGANSPFNGLLTDFVGASVVGTWTLRIHDQAGVDVGALGSWSFDVTTSGAGVPDAGSTLAMLGAAFMAMTVLRRRDRN